MGLSTFFSLSLSFFLLFSGSQAATTDLKGIDPVNPLLENLDISQVLPGLGSKGVLCERIQVSGHSRWKLKSYANSLRVTLAPSAKIAERLHNNIQVCFHWNTSLGLCGCGKEEWKTIQNGQWTSVMSPYEKRYLDIKFSDKLSGSVNLSVKEDFQQWRLLCLAVGFTMLVVAPTVSSWVPFYYTSSMAIGVFLVILIILFQVMKFLPTRRKSAIYVFLCTSALGAGSFLLHQFSRMMNSILVNFGLSEEMYNPVAILVVVGIILAGAALGYWVVRKFVISEDGTVDAGIAQFVKCAMFIIATTFIFQSSLDTFYATGTLLSCYAICLLLSLATRRRRSQRAMLFTEDASPWKPRSRQSSEKSPRGKAIWNSPKSSHAWSNSPVTELQTTPKQPAYYSTFHKTRNRKKFTKEEWEDFTRESTRDAIAGLAASPEFNNWVVDNADRLQLLPSYDSDTEVGSEYDSTDDNVAVSSNIFRLFDW